MAEVPMSSDQAGKPKVSTGLNPSKLPGNGYLSDNKLKKDPNHKDIQKSVTNPVIRKKKGMGSKFKEAFMGEDAKSIAETVIYDNAIPAIKDFVISAMNVALNMAFYGDARKGTSGSSSGSNYTSYNRFYRAIGGAVADTARRSLSRADRTRFDFDDIVIATRSEAESVLDNMSGLLDQYQFVTVGDFYDIVGVTSSYTDNKWGWKDIRGAGIRRVPNGYVLDLPRPEAVK